MEHLRRQWREASGWRDLGSHDMWNDAPAVIMVDKAARRNTYEVYVEGWQQSREWSLDAAKSKAEKVLGKPCRWERANTAKIKALHYYFGWTEEFTTPTIIYLGTPL